MRRMILRRSAGGFSLIELMAAAAILGLLASIAVPFVEMTIKRQKEQALRTALNDIREGIDAYKKAGMEKRFDVPIDGSGYPPTLNDLVTGIKDKQNGNRPLYFLRRVPRDPFHPDSSVAAIDTWGLRSFSSSAKEPAPGAEVFDVYSKSDKTGLNGVAYREW